TMREENGVKVKFAYNENEELVNIQNEHKELYRFRRNGNGDVVKEIGFDGLKREYRRDRAGKVVRIERPEDRWTEYEYNLIGQIIRSEYYDGSWEAYSYDKRGLMIEAVNEQIAVKLQRDAMGRIIEDQQGEHSVQSIFNRNGQRIAVTSSLGANVQHEYDKLGNLIQTQAGTKDLENSWEMQRQYSVMGQELSRTMSGGIQSNWEYDSGGHPIVHQVKSEKRIMRHRRYSWSTNNRLWKMVNELTQGQTDYGHDAFGSLAWAKYEEGQYDYKFPDEVGNLFETKERNDKEYGTGGKLIRDKEFFYLYDVEGNLIQKTGKVTWKYEWQGNGMLKQVEKPNGTKIIFEYDAVGRRTAKIVANNITRFVWDGNTPLHEWNYAVENRPEWIVDDMGFLQQDQPEPVTSDCITWVFEEGTFKPTAKIVGDQKYSIVTDYLGTPCQAFDEKGEKVWEMELDIYGKIRNLEGASSFIPFRYQGQYEDIETGLYYNRFRYYSPDSGMYLSQDPIGLAGGNVLYGYVQDNNAWVDVYGLTGAIATTWNQFQSKTSGWFGSRSEAATGWKVYQESSNSKELLAIGRLPDTEAAEKNLGMRRLNTAGWTPAVNDSWMQGGIDANKPFYLASDPIAANRFNPPGSKFPTTVFDRELKQLDSAKYVQKGKTMVKACP
ncbi:RHS repeat domain-containing protein, partial [Flavobacterium sp. '19STA2R22 D10 B1']|uniref:RHS repeat domain-containing protein n=1 Tax=Flavobacterium aerium TaxID=3037261 RepID=UPI00278C87CA